MGASSSTSLTRSWDTTGRKRQSASSVPPSEETKLLTRLERKTEQYSLVALVRWPSGQVCLEQQQDLADLSHTGPIHSWPVLNWNEVRTCRHLTLRSVSRFELLLLRQIALRTLDLSGCVEHLRHALATNTIWQKTLESVSLDSGRSSVDDCVDAMLANLQYCQGLQRLALTVRHGCNASDVDVFLDAFMSKLEHAKVKTSVAIALSFSWHRMFPKALSRCISEVNIEDSSNHEQSLFKCWGLEDSGAETWGDRGALSHVKSFSLSLHNTSVNENLLTKPVVAGLEVAFSLTVSCFRLNTTERVVVQAGRSGRLGRTKSDWYVDIPEIGRVKAHLHELRVLRPEQIHTAPIQNILRNLPTTLSRLSLTIKGDQAKLEIPWNFLRKRFPALYFFSINGFDTYLLPKGVTYLIVDYVGS
eukprot:gb/GEZN01006346.1/.p1 GENE.gb/GEZN01006346.1/~~gb/GEZN01006346.1/.p1  ORF type:complete len:417 (-),score=30.24 gb/GEZN01006346.1/:219-1469(-)